MEEKLNEIYPLLYELEELINFADEIPEEFKNIMDGIINKIRTISK